MRIMELRVEEFMGIRHFHLVNPDPKLVEVAGANGAGKSSVIKAVQALLGGKGTLVSRPVRDGADEAELFLDLQDMQIKCRLRPDGKRYLEVVDGDGNQVKKPQTTLDGLIGDLSFRPREFLEARPERQVEIVRGLAGEEFCKLLDDIDSKLARAVEERAAAKKAVDRIGRIDPVEEAQPADLSAISAELQEVEQFNAQREAMGQAITSATEHLDRCKAEVLRAADRVEQAKAALKESKAKLKEAESDVGKLPVPPPPRDTAELRARMASAGEQNEKAASFRRYQDRLKDKAAAAQTVNRWEDEVKKLRKARDLHARTAELPQGLQFTRDGLEVAGRPLDQLSDSEGTRLGVQIGVRLRPGIKVMTVDRGEQFDDLADLMAMAEEFGIQFLVATRGEGHTEHAIHLEAGEVRDLGRDDMAF